MAPKKKSAADKESARDVQETEEHLQAVILTDSFETRFAPLTTDRPRCLLPLANTPLIEYTLSFLASAGIQDVYIYCGAHTDQVENYIQQSQWVTPSSPFSVTVLRSESRSIGDAMRDLDNRGILVNDFVVVYGDVVSNVPLQAAIAEHKARRALDKNAIMTMVLREAGTRHRSKPASALPVFVIDPAKDRCVHYEQTYARGAPSTVGIDLELLTGHAELDLRGDLLDVGLDICTPDVLALWSDNFDYEQPRRGFLHSVLKDYELNGKTIHTHIVAEKYYAARARDFQTYASVTADILAGWTTPFTPYTNFAVDHSFTATKGGYLKEDGCKIARTSHISAKSLLGRGTVVGDDTIVKNSVIGRGCKIGKSCRIENAYIWDHVVLGDGCYVSGAIIAYDCELGQGSSLGAGVVLSYAVRIPVGTKVEAGRKITTVGKPSSDAQPDQTFQDYEASDSDDEDAVAQASSTDGFYSQSLQARSSDSISTLASSNDSMDDEPMGRPERSSFISTASSEDNQSKASASFEQESSSSIYDALTKDHDVSIIQLELQGLRLSNNASDHQLRKAVCSAFMRYLSEVRQKETPAQKPAVVKKVLTKNKMLFERLVIDHDEDEKTDQIDLLLVTQAELAKKPEGDSLLLNICNELYLMDVVEEEGFMQWWADEKSTATEELKAVRSKTAQFIKALEEAEEESSDEDD